MGMVLWRNTHSIFIYFKLQSNNLINFISGHRTMFVVDAEDVCAFRILGFYIRFLGLQFWPN